MPAFTPDRSTTMDYSGFLYRALNPLWASSPLSGEGAARFGGRFNPKGMPALYTSLRPETAMREANQVGAFQPITLVAYRAEIVRVFDGTDPVALSKLGISVATLADCRWRDTMLAGSIPATQQLAIDLKVQRYAGILVPSFAPHAQADDRNLVLWTWGQQPPAVLQLIDDQGRLSSPPQA
ncbi:RES family NAD+ phosphorylase [Novosphingobium sp. FSW06-99]|uniref:RES family NAD+ phosphorylase n=1 Tax=Novosphingobium sp. FSW06-99 TaxID=1739113 RepID=UPI001E2EDD09|nr:RES domain-containing protein [Novosphingobium sp. FSW06-99]